MKLRLCFLRVISALVPKVTEATDWVSSASSPNYRDMKMVTETESPFVSHTFPKGGNTIPRVAIVCNKFCASNASCQAFNLYPNNTHYICEFLLENFCNHSQRVALQAWPGATVWDKLTSSMTRSCIDNTLAGQLNSSLCTIGRSGCIGTWPSCNICDQSCANCTGIGFRNCTIWPEGHNKAPIFGFCNNRATIIIKRHVNISSGTVWPNYTMSFPDMHRLSKLSFYKAVKLQFNSTDINRKYTSTYTNFKIDPTGTLSGLTYKPQGGPGTVDGFLLKSALKPAPFIYVQPNSNCGSFWFLNATRTTANMTCPGGGIGMFGLVDISANPIKTGISWQQSGDKGVLYYTETRIDLLP